MNDNSYRAIEAHISPPRELHCPACLRIVTHGPQRSAVGYETYRCSECAVIFSDPMTPAGADWYEQSPIYRGRRALNPPMAAYRLDWRYRTLLSLRLRPGGRLLDVGCGTGSFLRLARARGYAVFGSDADRAAVLTATTSFGLTDAYPLTVEETALRDWGAPFDVITLFDVLEHLSNPRETLCSLANLLAPGGYLACSVPSAQRWPHWFDPIVDSPPHHLTLWTPESLVVCLAAAGLGTLQMRRSPLQPFDLIHPLQSFWRPLIGRAPAPATAGLALAYGLALVAAPAIQALQPRAGGFTLLGIGQKPGR